jgi:hypothetical protein
MCYMSAEAKRDLLRRSMEPRPRTIDAAYNAARVALVQVEIDGWREYATARMDEGRHASAAFGFTAAAELEAYRDRLQDKEIQGCPSR